jgi:hypothetical protein
MVAVVTEPEPIPPDTYPTPLSGECPKCEAPLSVLLPRNLADLPATIEATCANDHVLELHYLPP